MKKTILNKTVALATVGCFGIVGSATAEIQGTPAPELQGQAEMEQPGSVEPAAPATGPVLGESENKTVVDVAGKSVVEVLTMDAGEIGQFRSIFAQANMQDQLKGEGPFTVLVPSDEAIHRLPAEQREALLKPENKEKLQKLISNHIIKGKLMAVIPSKEESGVQSKPVAATPDRPEQESMPPGIAEATPEATPGESSALTEEPDAPAEGPEDPALPGAETPAEGPVATTPATGQQGQQAEVKAQSEAGNELQFRQDGAEIRVNDAAITQANIPAENGVIHVIDSVLIPEGFDLGAAATQ